jgi:hypothetical protein
MPLYLLQVRLEFERFTLADPDITGNCRTDYMQVTIFKDTVTPE